MNKKVIIDNRISVRLFIEKIDFDTLIPTGRVVQVSSFNSIVWNTSADFKKTATITFDNALEKLTTSIQHPDAHIGNPVNKPDFILSDYSRKIFDLFKNSQINYNPTNRPSKETFLTRDDFLYGHFPLNSYVTTDTDDKRCFLPLQRIWILSESDIAGNIKYNIWSGIITGMSDNFSDGGSTVSINVSGLSRLLELTSIFQHYRLALFQHTFVNKFADLLNENLYNYYQGTEICSRLNPIGLSLLSVFLANFYFTAQGNSRLYLSRTDPLPRDSAFFLQEPIWRINTDFFKCWEDIRSGNKSAVLSLPFSTEDPEIDIIIKDLIAGNTVYTSQLLPSVYVDPLLMEVYNTSAVNVFPVLIQQSFSLTDTTSLDAKDLLLKTAQSLLATVFEDDFGNIVMEIPKTWSAPDETGSFITEASYRKSAKSKLFRDVDHTIDYVIPDTFYSRSNKSFNEANIVTHVEVPTGFNYIAEVSEELKTLYLTGRTSILGDNNKYIELLQKRYGLRILTVNPIILSKYNLDKKTQADFQAALDAYAKAVLQLRNYACEALTIDFDIFLPHLSVDKNILFLHDEALWLIKDKTLSYTVSKDSASFTCNIVCSIRHKIYESAKYPFIDLLPELLS